MATAVISTFASHFVRSQPAWQIGEVTFKIYEISREPSARTELVEGARRACTSLVGQASSHGLGWITIHDAVSVGYVFANWWVDQSVVKRRGWVAPGGDISRLTEVTDEVTTCVWEIPLAAHERDAWVQHLLGGHRLLSGRRNRDLYLSATYPNDRV